MDNIYLKFIGKCEGCCNLFAKFLRKMAEPRGNLSPESWRAPSPEIPILPVEPVLSFDAAVTENILLNSEDTFAKLLALREWTEQISAGKYPFVYSYYLLEGD